MATDSHKPRILVVFYSRTGNTRRAARAIARATDADVEEIEDRASRRGLLGYLKSAYEALKQGQPTIVLPRRDPSAYDIVLVGSPTWASALPGPVRAYLTRFAGRLPAVAFFVTCGGSGAENVLVQMGRAAVKQPLATLILTQRDVGRAPAVLIGEFVDSLLRAWEALSKGATPAAQRETSLHQAWTSSCNDNRKSP